MTDKTLFRIIAAIVLVFALYVAVNTGMQSRDSQKRIDQLRASDPIDATIDASLVGETVIPFTQQFVGVHGIYLYLDGATVEHQGFMDPSFWKGLSGRIDVETAEGGLMATSTLDPETPFIFGNKIVFSRLPQVEEVGDFVARIHIYAGAANVKGSRDLLGKYHLCGCESFPAMICGMFSWGASIIALISVIYLLPPLRIKVKKR